MPVEDAVAPSSGRGCGRLRRMPALDASSDSAQRRRATVDVQGTVASFADLLLAVCKRSCS